MFADDIVQGGPLLHQRPGPVYVEFAIPGDLALISCTNSSQADSPSRASARRQSDMRTIVLMVQHQRHFTQV